tara:strand:- start:560 stop:763 length:204 start_codon:yes stop_codon:yes gene_type:complete
MANSMRIKTEKIYYFGYLQGYKVYLDGKKYPREYGHFYTTFDESKAVEVATKEYDGKKYSRLFNGTF